MTKTGNGDLHHNAYIVGDGVAQALMRVTSSGVFHHVCAHLHVHGGNKIEPNTFDLSKTQFC
jgi:hypothetical protein